MKPRVLFVSRERFRLPLDDTQRRKWDAVGERLDYRILAASQPGSPLHADRLSLASRSPVLDGPLFYLRLPFRIARELRSFQPESAFVQGVHEAAAFLLARALTTSRTALVLDVQGDWREATRSYGSPLRRLLNPFNDLIGAFAVRRADVIRTISPFTSALVRARGREPAGEFAPFVDVEAFVGRDPAPLPAQARVLYVGVLERVKGFDVLVDAWPHVRSRLPEAELHVVGRGTLAPLVRRLVGDGVTWTERLDRDGVIAAMDASTLLCLPSRAEGLGRVVVEAMLRGRAVVGANAGGIADLVEDGENGLLVAAGDVTGLAGALVRVLSEPALAGRMGSSARRRGEAVAMSPDEYAERLALVIAAGHAG